MEELRIDSKGLAARYKNRNGSSLSCIMELLDNSLKAKSNNINIINNKNLFIVHDNGNGINKNNIDNVLTQYKRHGEENINSLSHFGIGLKSSLYYKLKNDKSFGFIISISKTNRGLQPLIVYLKYINEKIYYNTINLPIGDLQDKLLNFINQGTIIFAENVSDIDHNNLDEETIFSYIETFIEKYKNNKYGEDIYDDDEKIYQDLSKLYTPILNDNFDINYNQKICKKIPFIKDTDDNIFNIDIYIKIKENGEQILFIKDFNIAYILKGRVKQIEHDFNINEDNVIKLGKLKLYKSEPNQNERRIQITVPNNRVLQRNIISNTGPIQKHLYLYMRINLDISDLNYLKEYLLEERKLPVNYLDVSDLENTFKYINIAITKICINKELLKYYNWKIDDTHQMVYINNETSENNESDDLNQDSNINQDLIENDNLNLDDFVDQLSNTSSHSIVSDIDEISDKNIQSIEHTQSNRGSSLGPGGYLYLFTLEDSDDWTLTDNKILYKFGCTEDLDLNNYYKGHQRKHPTKKLKDIYHIKTGAEVRRKETEILSILQQKNLIYNTSSTTRSEYVATNNPQDIISIINSVVPEN